MKTLRLIFGDQLSHDLSVLSDLDKANDIVLMMEVLEECAYVPHHKQKLVLILSAMRHFAAVLQQQGHRVCYIHYGSVANVHSMTDAVHYALTQHPDINSVVITECGEYRLQQEIISWQQQLSLPVQILNDDRFVCDLPRFFRWAHGKKQLRMEYFYRDMRRYTGLLMHGDTPEGGKWNYDADNRKACPPDLVFPEPNAITPDAITSEVMALVDSKVAAEGTAREASDALINGRISKLLSILINFLNYTFFVFKLINSVL